MEVYGHLLVIPNKHFENIFDIPEEELTHIIKFTKKNKKQRREMNNSQHYIGKIVKAQIDRPLGSSHPKHGFIYPVNYGYIPNTVSGDGEELDAYILGTNLPLSDFEGKCIAIIHRLNDNKEPK